MNCKTLLFLFVFVVVVLFINTDISAQCAMCKEAIKSNIESGGDGRKFGLGINTGILYLMAVPYLIVGTIACAFYKKQIIAKVQGFIKK